MADVRLDYAVPEKDLVELITLFYRFHADVPVFEDVERADYAQIRFVRARGAPEYRFPDGSVQQAADIHVLGPTCGAVKVRAPGPVDLFGMGLTAAGWSALIGSDASTMLNRTVDAMSVFGAGRLREVYDVLWVAPDVHACVATVTPLVQQLSQDRPAGTLHFMHQVDRWLADASYPQIEELAALTGLSRRQVERKCKAMYGAPPKLLARKYRALRAAVALASGDESANDLIERGFYDQSHLIREIKQFTGMTPRQFRAEPTLLSHLVTTQRTALGDKVGPLIGRT